MNRPGLESPSYYRSRKFQKEMQEEREKAAKNGGFTDVRILDPEEPEPFEEIATGKRFGLKEFTERWEKDEAIFFIGEPGETGEDIFEKFMLATAIDEAREYPLLVPILE